VGPVHVSIRFARILTGILAGVCIAAAAGLSLLSLVSYQAAKAVVANWAGADAAVRLTPTFYSHGQNSLRLTAALLLCVGLLLAFTRKRIAGYISSAAVQFPRLSVELKAAAARIRAEDPWHLAALGAILLAGAAIRLRYLFEPVRYDEAYTFLTYASRPFFVGLLYYTTNNHILNTVLMRVSYLLFGDAPWALRLPVVAAGILVIPLVYCAVRLCSNKNAALLATALAAVSFPLVEYSVIARGYTFGAAFLLGMIIFVRLIDRASIAFLPAGLCAALAVYSVPTTGSGVAAVLVWMAFTQRLRDVLRTAAVTVLATGVLFLPPLATAALFRMQNNLWVVRLPAAELVAALPRSFGFLCDYWTMRLPLLLAIAIALGAVLSSAIAISTRTRRPPLFLTTVVVCTLLLLVTRFDPPRRVWLFLLPLYLGAATEGWALIVRNRRIVPLVAVAITIWMGIDVLRGGTLYRPGGTEYAFHNCEEWGFPSAQALVLQQRSHIERGAGFVYSYPHDAPIRYALFHLRIPYRPSAGGELLIVTPLGESPRIILSKGNDFDPANVEIVRKLASYENADVYLGSERIVR
jgi:hypothetical protein